MPFRETATLHRPLSPYAATKQAGEHFVELYHSLYGLPVTIDRLFTVYGPRGRPDMAPYLFTDRIYRSLPIKVFGTDESERDYTYVGDVVQGILKSVRAPRTFRIYNIGGARRNKLHELIRCIEEQVGKRAKIIMTGKQKGDAPLTWASITRAKREIGYTPKVTLQEGIPKLVSWYLKYRAR